jgi:DNA polymerase
VAINGVSLYLYPIFHPAAALYTPAMLTTLREDFLRLPELLAQAAPPAGAAAPLAVDVPATPAGAPPAETPAPPAATPVAPARPEQLGLF